MAGSISNYVEDAVIGALLRGTAFPSASGSVYVALFTAAPSDSGGGTEVTGGSYARVAVSRATGSWDAPTDVSGSQKTANTSAITFASPTANWGTVTHFGIFDAASSGNLLIYGDLGTSRNILSGDSSPSFAAGTLTFSIS